MFMFHFLLIVLIAFAKKRAFGLAASGTILSAQFHCDMPCKEEFALHLSIIDPKNGVPTRLEELLPPAPIEARRFPLHTVYEPHSKIFMVFGLNYPRVNKMTVWTSITSGHDYASMNATTFSQCIDYPISNNSPSQIARIVLGPENVPHVIFANGEVHAIDMTAGTFTLKHRIISDAQLLYETKPNAAAAQVYDSVDNLLYSVIITSTYAYLVISNFSNPQAITMSDWILLDPAMNLYPGFDAMQISFPTQIFTNAMIVRNIPGDDNKEIPRLLLTKESLNDVGFDQLVFIKIHAGVMDVVGSVYNLKDSGLVFKCEENNCDSNHVSTYDTRSGTLYFQAFMNDENFDTAGSIAFNKVELSIDAVSNNVNWIVSTVNNNAPFGYNAFQFYNF